MMTVVAFTQNIGYVRATGCTYRRMSNYSKEDRRRGNE